MVAKASVYTLVDGILYYIGHVSPRAVVPSSLKKSLIDEYHSGVMAGHFSGPRVHQEMSRKWWWHQMYQDILNAVKSCLQCATVTGPGKKQLPPLQSIPVSHPFQIVGVDIMELPLTSNGNKYAIVFQNLFTKWPMVYATPDQKAERIAKLLTQKIVPMFGVPEALLSNRGTNLLLSYLMQDVCKMLGIRKLNTTSHHPQCNGMIERFNHTLKMSSSNRSCVITTQVLRADRCFRLP